MAVLGRGAASSILLGAILNASFQLALIERLRQLKTGYKIATSYSRFAG